MKKSKSKFDICLEKVSTNNLKAIDVSFPRGALSVVTGVSGSGKSSLVFDTLYAESYRRYVESLSSYARQYIAPMPKPDLEAAHHLQPSISVKQNRALANSRSTVGTMTESYDMLRILFANLSKPKCPSCSKYVEKVYPESLYSKLLSGQNEHRVYVAVSLERFDANNFELIKNELIAQGYSLFIKSNKSKALSELTLRDKNKSFLVVDRFKVDKKNKSRIVSALKQAFAIGKGSLHVFDEGTKENKNKVFQNDIYYQGLRCSTCGEEFREPSPALFSFNHPLGACDFCQGFGYESVLNLDKAIDKKKHLGNGGIPLWNFGMHKNSYEIAKKSASKNKIDTKKTFANYTDKEWQWLLNGSGRDFQGVFGYYSWLESKKHKAHYRIHAARFRKYILCSKCDGAKLNPENLIYKINDQSIDALSNYQIKDLVPFFEQVRSEYQKLGEKSHGESFGLDEAFEELLSRCDYLLRVGLSYLSLARKTRTLSGGEQQRIHMSRCLGSSLTSTLYCLDEPTTGLHARDSENLLGVLCELRDQGNTVVVVEHDQTLMKGADRLLAIGPKAGHEGGYLSYDAKPAAYKDYVSFPFSSSYTLKELKKDPIVLKGVKTHNLKNVTLELPSRGIIAVCGVSGSGKTSLIQHTLFPSFAQYIECLGLDSEATEFEMKSLGPKAVIEKFDKAMLVSQIAIGRSSRSNIATYLGLMDTLRKLFASEQKAKNLDLKPGHFSFNSPGGRCENCRGLGLVSEDLSFLGQMDVLCSVCNGARFEIRVLSVKLRGKNLNEVLKLTLAEARQVFYDVKKLCRPLDAAIEMGLGYLTLGQATSSFSGGEAQRLKLLSLLQDSKNFRPSILIFDEPSTGLADSDVAKLISQFQDLQKKGHLVIIIEHHLGILRSADYLIEVGPEAAEKGGEIVYEGLPKDLRADKYPLSQTAQFLAEK